MANTQFDVRGQDYSRILLPLARQEKSKLIDKVYVKPNVTGKVFYQDQIGRWTMSSKTSANPATPMNDPNLSRTRVDILTQNDSRAFDRSLSLQEFSDPMSEVTMCLTSAVGLSIDTAIVTALGGTAYRGEAGGTSTALPTGQIIADSSLGLTVAKIRQAAKKMNAAGVPAGDRTLVITATGLEQLLGTTQATSLDFNNVKALVNGEMDTFIGFKVVTLEDGVLPKSGNIASCYAFHKTGLCWGMVEELFLRIDERPDLSYSKQVYYEYSGGAARLEEAKVVKINIDESVVVTGS